MSEYRVALRHTTLLESAALEAKGDDQHFIATAVPPPTNSILTLHQVEPGEPGEDTPQFFVVDKVVEVESDDHVGGVLGKLTDAQAHEDASMMGTEHLEDGQAPPEDHAPAMAMPSPVVDPDPSDIESDRPQGEHLEAEPDADPDQTQRAAGETPDPNPDASAADAEGGQETASDAQSGAGSSKRTRRRNRKRR